MAQFELQPIIRSKLITLDLEEPHFMRVDYELSHYSHRLSEESLSIETQQLLEHLYEILLPYISTTDITNILKMLPLDISQRILQNRKLMISLFVSDAMDRMETVCVLLLTSNLNISVQHLLILNITQYPVCAKQVTTETTKDYLATIFEEYQYYIFRNKCSKDVHRSSATSVNICIPNGFIKNGKNCESNTPWSDMSLRPDSKQIEIRNIYEICEQTDKFNGEMTSLNYSWNLLSTNCKSFQELVQIFNIFMKKHEDSLKSTSFEHCLRMALIPGILMCESYVVIHAERITETTRFHGNAESGGGSGGSFSSQELLIFGIYDVNTIILMECDLKISSGGSSACFRGPWNEKWKYDWQ